MEPSRIDQLITRSTQILISVTIIGFLIVEGKIALCPLTFSFLFSFLLHPAANYFEKKYHFGRGAASFASVFMLLLFLSLVFLAIFTQLHTLTNDWPALKDQFSKVAERGYSSAVNKLNIRASTPEGNIHHAALEMISSNLKMLGLTLISISSVLIFWVFVVFETFFILYYRHLLFNFLVAIAKSEGRPVLDKIIMEIQTTVRSYLLGIATQITVVTTASCLAFLIIGIKYPLLLGLIVGLFNIVPYAGIFTALIICMVITAATVATTKVIMVFGAIVLLHLADNNLLLPLIVGSKVKINALTIILGLTVGALIWEIPGMILSIPVLAISKIIFNHIRFLKPLGALLGDGKNEATKKWRRAERRRVT